jgi:hypothetical protein
MPSSDVCIVCIERTTAIIIFFSSDKIDKNSLCFFCALKIIPDFFISESWKDTLAIPFFHIIQYFCNAKQILSVFDIGFDTYTHKFFLFSRFAQVRRRETKKMATLM